MSSPGDFPLSEAPACARKGLLSISMVLFSFTFFTGTMFAGGKLGMAFPFADMLWIAAIGNGLLALYAAGLAFIASRSGLNTVLMGRFCFGEAGSRLSDFLLGFAELGWYAWGTATIAIVLVKLLGLADSLSTPLMVAFGLGFSVTAIVGYKGLDVLSRVSVPLMFALLMVSMYIATGHAGGFKGLAAVIPHETMTFSAAVTMVFGTFASGATQATNWTRLSRTGRIAIVASVVSFLVGNGLMVVAGAWCAMVYQQADIVEVLVLQGLSFAAVIMLCLNLWTIQGPTIYNVSAAACHLLRSERRRTMTLIAAGIGVLLAIGGMYEMLIPFLVLLGSIIPPVGGVIMADFWYRHGGNYPLLATARLPRYNFKGLTAYGVGAVVAYCSPWVAPLVGILVAAGCYVVLLQLSDRHATATLQGEQ
ncbi:MULTISPECIES: cytosine permease [unclassified Pseudomonas]|uniref:cytosine permease n=1 Tax=unclassified Pseudomonas TaxID=196821 RepID=UPI000BCBBE2C|nr:MULTISPECIES: cytosine permease [unclassified Pseudomonas]PVZ19734.1 purine-cytosine permease-like protein [Pseudomonas sp. URIL14HWK12:I12]PVZ22681.1 purine-cytosine permease-like protein [Pseudomonas sp. URIL14HWK12:I10]PVZ37689.1 purine-cytosine permease-like protein [Pseudomonas sp. URIL14HWK12:I11]SNZ15538.1 cytosine permease [Pseudomonas sp. URIL14HWK12:I9]